MAKIATRQIKITVNDPDTAKVLVWCKPLAAGVPTYEDPVAKEIAWVEGQAPTFIVIPSEGFDVTDGEYYLGIAGQDAAGNISAIGVKQYFFDFTAPAVPLLEVI